MERHSYGYLSPPAEAAWNTNYTPDIPTVLDCQSERSFTQQTIVNGVQNVFGQPFEL
jgi:hypothetical protein